VEVYIINMNSITQNITVVNSGTININVNLSDKASDGSEWLEKTKDKWQEVKIKSVELAAKMKKADMNGRAGRMAQCGDTLEYRFCKDCSKWQIGNVWLCRDRLCPVCKWRLSIKRYCLMFPVFQELVQDYGDKRFSFITLSVKNCKVDNIKATVKKMYKIWQNMQMRKICKENLKGFARSFEITYNDKRRDFHPHFHVIAMWEDSAYHDELIRAWLEICNREGLKVDIKAQDGREILRDSAVTAMDDMTEDITGAILETFKYETKTSDIEGLNIMTFKEFANQMSGLRTVSLGGIIREIARRQGVKENQLEHDDEEQKVLEVCGNCGSVELTKAMAQWSGAMGEYKWSYK
jgi:plasmid rolling circle replication initiator protein Rep